MLGIMNDSSLNKCVVCRLIKLQMRDFNETYTRITLSIR